MIGLIEDTRKIITQGFKDEGDIIALLGVTKNDLSVSELSHTILGISTDDMIANGCLPELDFQLEKRVQETVLKLANAQLLKSAHDCSDGGLAVAIAECCFSSLGRDAVGATIRLDSNELPTETLLFGETASRIVISFAADGVEKVLELVGTCPFQTIGNVTGQALRIDVDALPVISTPVSELESVWNGSLQRELEPAPKKGKSEKE